MMIGSQTVSWLSSSGVLVVAWLVASADAKITDVDLHMHAPPPDAVIMNSSVIAIAGIAGNFDEAYCIYVYEETGEVVMNSISGSTRRNGYWSTVIAPPNEPDLKWYPDLKKGDERVVIVKFLPVLGSNRTQKIIIKGD